jgi:hypothetical protein
MIIYDNYRYCAQIIATQFRTTWNVKCVVESSFGNYWKEVRFKFYHFYFFVCVYNDTRSYRGSCVPLPTT